MSLGRKSRDIIYLLLFLGAFSILYMKSFQGITKSELEQLLRHERNLQKTAMHEDHGPPRHEDNVEVHQEIHTESAKQQAGKVASLRRSNRGIAEYSQQFYDKLHTLTSRKAEARDPELISLVREIFDPPTAEGRNKPSRGVDVTPQAKEVDTIMKEKTDGFFFECGALDGERSSNSFYLEHKRNWTGILVEMDPHYYTQLLGKNRRSWSINACLSPFNYVTELPFFGDAGGQGRIGLNSNPKRKQVPCFPFETLMLALNRTHIDYFSLDVEGVEYSILQTIPFNTITVDVMSVEYGHDQVRKNQTLKFMEDKGFRLHKDIHTSNPAVRLYVEDFIFIRKGFKLSNLEPS